MALFGRRRAAAEARFETLYEQCYGRVLAYALRRAAPEVAHDVVGDTFLVAWRRIDSVPEDALPWLLGVARKTLANHRRSARRQDALVGELRAEEATALRESPQFEPGELEAVALALERLSDVDRELLRLTVWDDLSVKDAAVVVGMSEVACRVRLHRARRRLAAELAQRAPFREMEGLRR
jgi:RNA polymerase sigma-70 factor (ECF subfamily)